MLLELVIYGILLILLMAVCDNKYSRRCYVPLKAVCSASFLVILILNNMFSESLHKLLIALIACFVGDVLMAYYNVRKDKHYMTLGTFVFIFGHIFLLIYMCEDYKPTYPLVFILPVFICGLMYLLYKKIHLHMGRLFYPSFVYCYFVSAMSLKAIEVGAYAIAQGNSHPAPYMIMAAGILFFLSDFSILFLYFYHFHKRWEKRLTHHFNLVTYYVAILLFVFSL